MSQMKELYQKVAADPALQQQFVGILKNAEEIGTETIEANLIEFAASIGFSVSIAEAREFFAGLKNDSNEDGGLSDQELDLVAGGKSMDGINSISLTVVSLGIGCAMMSFFSENMSETYKSCSEMFN